MLILTIVILSICLIAFFVVAYIFVYDYVCEQLDLCNYFGEDK